MDAAIGVLDDSVQFLILSLTENIPIVGKLIGKEANKGVDSLFEMLSGPKEAGGESKSLAKITQSLDHIQTSIESLHQDLNLLETQLSEIRDNEYFKPLDDFLRYAVSDINERSQALIQVLNEKTDDAYQAFAEGLDAQTAKKDALDFINRTIQFARIIDGNAGGRYTTTAFCVFSAHFLKKSLWEHDCYNICKKYELFLFGLFGSAAAVSFAYLKYFLGINLNGVTASLFQTAYSDLQKEISTTLKDYINRVITPFFESNPNIKRLLINDANLYDNIPFTVGELTDQASMASFESLKKQMLQAITPYGFMPMNVQTVANGWGIGDCFNKCLPTFSEFNVAAIDTLKRKAPGKSLGAIFEAAGCPITRVPDQYIIVRDISLHEAVPLKDLSTVDFRNYSIPAHIFYGFILDPWDDTLTCKSVPIYAELLIPVNDHSRPWRLTAGMTAIRNRLEHSTFSVIRRTNAPKPKNEIWDYANSSK